MNNSMNYDFSFVKDELEQKSFNNMRDVLNDNVNLREYVKNFSGKSFMYDMSEEKKLISYDKRNDNHSGASLALCLRMFKYILNNGFDKFQENYMLQQESENM